MLPQIVIILKKASNKSCSELYFVQTSPRAHMFISLQSGVKRLQRLVWSKYYYVWKWQITYKLELNAAKNTHHIKKMLKIKVVRNWISYKKVCERICLSTLGVEQGARKIDIVKILYCTETANYIQIKAPCYQKYASHQQTDILAIEENTLIYNT